MKLIYLAASILIVIFAANIPQKTIHATYTPPIVAQPASATETPPPAEITYQRKIGQFGGICINNRTNASYTNEIVSREEVAHWASKYWNGNTLEIAIALTLPEGQRDVNCIGDDIAPYYNQPTHDGRHWGESIGLYQYRTIIEQTNKGGCDDINWQRGNIERQTQCAFNKWNARKSFQPWSAYTSGRYKKSLGK